MNIMKLMNEHNIILWTEYDYVTSFMNLGEGSVLSREYN